LIREALQAYLDTGPSRCSNEPTNGTRACCAGSAATTGSGRSHLVGGDRGLRLRHVLSIDADFDVYRDRSGRARVNVLREVR
jgi:hypothetical protein